MNGRKKTVVGLTLCFALAVAPLGWVAFASRGYPAKPFGGGGGDTVSASSNRAACGPLCEAIIGWLVGKGLDYISSNANNPAGCGGPNTCPAGPVGGGGGDAFGPGNCVGDGCPSDPTQYAKTN
jgi:hypothetical protein